MDKQQRSSRVSEKAVTQTRLPITTLYYYPTTLPPPTRRPGRHGIFRQFQNTHLLPLRHRTQAVPREVLDVEHPRAVLVEVVRHEGCVVVPAARASPIEQHHASTMTASPTRRSTATPLNNAADRKNTGQEKGRHHGAGGLLCIRPQVLLELRVGLSGRSARAAALREHVRHSDFSGLVQLHTSSRLLVLPHAGVHAHLTKTKVTPHITPQSSKGLLRDGRMEMFYHDDFTARVTHSAPASATTTGPLADRHATPK